MTQISEKSSEKYTRTEDYREKKRRTCLLVAPIGTEYQVLTLRDYLSHFGSSGYVASSAATHRRRQPRLVPWRDGRCGCSGGPARRRRARARWLHCCRGRRSPGAGCSLPSSSENAAADDDTFFNRQVERLSGIRDLLGLGWHFWAATAISGHLLKKNI